MSGSRRPKVETPVGLLYVGDDVALPDVPARDLDGHDLARLVYQGSVGAIASEPARGRRPDDGGYVAALASVVARLLSSGLYETAWPGSLATPPGAGFLDTSGNAPPGPSTAIAFVTITPPTGPDKED